MAISKPATNAIIASVFAHYIGKAFLGGGGGGGPAAGGDVEATPAVAKVLGLVCVWSVTGINSMGATAGARVANGFLVLKMLALSGIVGVGFASWLMGTGKGAVVGDEGGWFQGPAEVKPVEWWAWMGNFGTAIFGALYCYGGWETVSPVPGR